VPSLSIRVQLQITALIGELFCFAANLGPSDEDVVDRAQILSQFPTVSMLRTNNRHWRSRSKATPK
jgi:hypothetical protein